MLAPSVLPALLQHCNMDTPAHVCASLLAAGYTVHGELDDPTKFEPREMRGTSSEEEEEDYGSPHRLNLSISMSGSEEDEEGDVSTASQEEAEVICCRRHAAGDK